MSDRPWQAYIPAEQEVSALRAGLGEALRAARQRRGWTLAELGRRSGVPARHISRLERGLRRPRPDCLRPVARALEPERFEEFAAELELAAGDSLRRDSLPGGRPGRTAEQLPPRWLLERSQELRARIERRTAEMACEQLERENGLKRAQVDAAA